MIGKKFNFLSVKKFSHIDKEAYWICECICGTIKIIRGVQLRNGKTKSCGCLRKQFLKGKFKEKSYAWKGEEVGYVALHTRMRKDIKKPKLCIFCKQKPPEQIANISQKYKKTVDDWMWLCEQCHHRYDKGWKLIKGRWWKTCKCKKFLEINVKNFHINRGKGKNGGWQVYCKECMKLYVRNHFEE